jgi:hypothetical protein
MNRATFKAGDRVQRGADRGVVRQCRTADGATTMRDGRPYLKVYITDGPAKGSWDWPDRWLREEETEDRRPVEAPEPRLMLNNCQRCGRYKYVLCLSGPWSYLCGRCHRELTAAPVAGAKASA